MIQVMRILSNYFREAIRKFWIVLIIFIIFDYARCLNNYFIRMLLIIIVIIIIYSYYISYFASECNSVPIDFAPKFIIF